MKIINRKIWALGLLIPLFMACSEEDPAVSSISEFETWAPTMGSATPAVTASELTGGIYTFDFALDSKQITSVSLDVSAGASSTAVEGLDFEILTTSVDLAAFEGMNGFTVSIEIFGDYVPEDVDEKIYLTFSSDVPTGVDDTEYLVATIVDDIPLCEYDITNMVGALPGGDITIDGFGWPAWDSEVVISGGTGAYQITGLGRGWMQDFWGEAIDVMNAVDMEVAENDYVAVITIPSQLYMQTTYGGSAQDPYLIEGTGVLTKCTKTLVIEYSLTNYEVNWADWTNANGYMSEEKFTAVLTLP